MRGEDHFRNQGMNQFVQLIVCATAGRNDHTEPFFPVINIQFCPVESVGKAEFLSILNIANFLNADAVFFHGFVYRFFNQFQYSQNTTSRKRRIKT